MSLGQEERYFWRDETLDGTELLCATYFTHAFAPHSHEEYSISIVMAGVEQFRYRRARHVAPTGTLILINPGEVHTGERAVPEGWQNRSFYPSVAVLEQIQHELTGKAATPLSFPTLWWTIPTR